MNLPTWNLNEFYSSFKDKQINKDLHSLKKKINLFSIKYKGKLGKLKKTQLIRSLIEFEKVDRKRVAYSIAYTGDEGIGVLCELIEGIYLHRNIDYGQDHSTSSLNKVTKQRLKQRIQRGGVQVKVNAIYGLEKINEDYAGDARRLVDVVRLSIVVKNINNSDQNAESSSFFIRSINSNLYDKE